MLTLNSFIYFHSWIITGLGNSSGIQDMLSVFKAQDPILNPATHSVKESVYFIFITFYLFQGTCQGTQVQGTAFRSWFSPSTLWVPGIEPRSSGLAVRAFTQRAISLVQNLLFQKNVFFLLFVIASQSFIVFQRISINNSSKAEFDLQNNYVSLPMFQNKTPG